MTLFADLSKVVTAVFLDISVFLQFCMFVGIWPGFGSFALPCKLVIRFESYLGCTPTHPPYSLKFGVMLLLFYFYFVSSLVLGSMEVSLDVCCGVFPGLLDKAA